MILPKSMLMLSPSLPPPLPRSLRSWRSSPPLSTPPPSIPPSSPAFKIWSLLILMAT